jgi:hypothetical protein
MTLALAALPLPPDSDHPVVVLFAAGLSALIVAAVVAVPWERLPRFAEAVPPLTYFVVIALLRDSQGGASSGYSALAMLPVFWLALYGTRSQLAIGIAGLASMFLAPLLLLGAPEYPLTEWRRALLWICVAPIVGYTVQALVVEQRARADDARRTLAYMASVTAVTRQMAGSSEPDAVREAVCSAALAIAGAGAVVFNVPVALAAFVAGVLFSIRPIAREARREVLPFRDLFAVLFFVAIGTLVDPAAVAREPGWLVVFIGLVALKTVVIRALDAIFAIPGRDWQVAVGLAQIGEFSFVVLGLGVAAGVVSAGQSSAALAAAALTIAASAVGARLFPKARTRAA